MQCCSYGRGVKCLQLFFKLERHVDHAQRRLPRVTFNYGSTYTGEWSNGKGRAPTPAPTGTGEFMRAKSEDR